MNVPTPIQLMPCISFLGAAYPFVCTCLYISSESIQGLDSLDKKNNNKENVSNEAPQGARGLAQ